MKKSLVLWVVVLVCFQPYYTFGGMLSVFAEALKGGKAVEKTAIKIETVAKPASTMETQNLKMVTAGGLRKASEYKKTADNDPEAQYNLGRCYELGNGGVDKDTDEAIKCYRKAADKGNAHAKAALKALGK